MGSQTTWTSPSFSSLHRPWTWPSFNVGVGIADIMRARGGGVNGGTAMVYARRSGSARKNTESGARLIGGHRPLSSKGYSRDGERRDEQHPVSAIR